jgi:hypothetical protein
LDKREKRLNRRLRQKWERKVQNELTECFGGAVRYRSPGTFILPDPLTGKVRSYVEKDQVLIVSGCDDRDAYLAKKERIQNLVVEMGKDLNQAAVVVLAFPSDSYLIEFEG